MLNQVAVEALYSATYVENYLDCVENLPDDLQRHLSRMRDVDAHYRECLRAVNADLNQALATKDERNYKKRAKAIERIKTSLINAQEYGDEKLQIVQLLQDLIDHKSRQLDIDYRNLVSCLDYGNGNSVKEEAMAVDAPSVKETVSAGGGAGGSAALQGAPSASGGQGGAPRTPASPPNNHDRDRDRTDKDRTGERASKRARRSRNDTATGNEHERSSGGAGGLEGRTGGVEREPPAPAPPPPPPPPDPPQRNAGGNSSNKKAGTGKLGTGKKKKRKCRQSAQNNQRDETPPPEDPDPIDPDEPTYCLCDQISFGEMILCDNDLCPIEWFHFSCVSLSTKPKGKWFCPKCRGDRPNVMKPKSQFLKELERYNKEKEEKA